MDSTILRILLPNGKVLLHFSIKAVTSDFKNDEAIFNKTEYFIFKEKIYLQINKSADFGKLIRGFDEPDFCAITMT